MEITLWGVRGSIASPTPTTQFYGPNTACIEVRPSANILLVFDAGSGIRLLGDNLPDSGTCHLFFTHGHMDHTMGLGFFKPLNNPNWTTHLYLPEKISHITTTFFDGQVFPVAFNNLRGNIVQHLISAGQTIELVDGAESVSIQTIPTNHPGGNFAYRVKSGDTTFVYTGDHEITDDPQVIQQTKDLLAGAHVAIVDAPYNKQDYLPGWGHSTWESWVEIANTVPVEAMVLSHHAPARTDKELDILQHYLSDQTWDNGMRVFVAREGMNLTPPLKATFSTEKSTWLLDFLDDLSQYRDESVILDRILAKTREITHADAGTVFLAEGNELVFAYTHNDTLFPVHNAYKYAYTNMRMPIATDSLAGYAAVTGETLNIADVHNLPEGAPYSFNKKFDATTGYVTSSVLNVPFFGRNKQLLGVIQLLNSLHHRTKKPVPFTPGMEDGVIALAREAAKFLEFGAIMRQNIYRMLHVTSIHDPHETGPHAERVGSIVAELYQRFAEKHSFAPENIRHFKSQLRLAAMLHDIGKVGISDLILKKPGPLTDDEKKVMRSHVTMGGDLLDTEEQDITRLACVIAKHHHQKWDGTGYAGSSESGALSGENIPLAARLTAIADVFDALVSSRAYKKPWTFEEASALLQTEAKKHFDPLLVECFMEIQDVIHMIYQRFPDEEPASAS